MHESRYIVKQILCFSKIRCRSIKLHYPKTADCTAAANKSPCHRILAWRRAKAGRPEGFLCVDRSRSLWFAVVTEALCVQPDARNPFGHKPGVLPR
jgi:hypothetical protein